MQAEEVNVELVEDLVARMLQGMQSAPTFTPAEGLSAAMTFAYRFARVIISLSASEESRQFNGMTAASTLRRMASQLDFELADSTKKETLH